MRTLLDNRFTILLVILFPFILVVPPLVEYMVNTSAVPWALSVILNGILLATYRENRSWLAHPLIIVAAVASFIAMWSCQCMVTSPTLEQMDSAIFATLLFIACRSMVGHLARRDSVDRESLAASICIYLTFGMAMSRLYWLLHVRRLSRSILVSRCRTHQLSRCFSITVS